jgi:hypothetical protein
MLLIGISFKNGVGLHRFNQLPVLLKSTFFKLYLLLPLLLIFFFSFWRIYILLDNIRGHWGYWNSIIN